METIREKIANQIKANIIDFEPVTKQPIFITIPGKKMADFKSDAIFDGCLFVNFAGNVYYFDNSTGELIVKIWKDKNLG